MKDAVYLNIKKLKWPQIFGPSKGVNTRRNTDQLLSRREGSLFTLGDLEKGWRVISLWRCEVETGLSWILISDNIASTVYPGAENLLVSRRPSS